MGNRGEGVSLQKCGGRMDMNQSDSCECWMWLSPGRPPALHAMSLDPLREWGLWHCQQSAKPQPLLGGAGLRLNTGLKHRPNHLPP